MGCFSYICNKCGQNIRYQERAVLRHIRHGEVLGEAVGTYDTYGGVFEDDVFRSHGKDKKSNINTHEEICKSEFDFKDSNSKESFGSINKNFEGQEVGLNEYLEIMQERGIIDMHKISTDSATKKEESKFREVFLEYNELPEWKEEFIPKSGVAAFHAKCYYSLKDNPKHQALRVKPSAPDPYQGCGEARNKFK